MSQEAEPVNGRTTRRYNPAEIRVQVGRGKEALSRWFFRRPPSSQPLPIHHPEGLFSPPVSLKDYLLNAMSDPMLALDPMPMAIELKDFGREAERLLHLSLADPLHPEYATAAYLDDAGRLLLPKQPIRGDITSVLRSDLPEGMRQVLMIHTHGNIETPFSPNDLRDLFVPANEKTAVPAELLIMPNLKLLMLRTRHTPYLSGLSRELLAHMMELDPAMNEEREFLSNAATLGGKEKKILHQLSNRRMFMLTRISQDYHLAMYSCSYKDNIALPAT
ncbi:MAG: hypothetical protein Q7O66_21380 [Dehalococcoidia bacterium]|nr:hypothetical protein [Dehalococcoidia bacterium]